MTDLEELLCGLEDGEEIRFFKSPENPLVFVEVSKEFIPQNIDDEPNILSICHCLDKVSAASSQVPVILMVVDRIIKDIRGYTAEDARRLAK